MTPPCRRRGAAVGGRTDRPTDAAAAPLRDEKANRIGRNSAAAAAA